MKSRQPVPRGLALLLPSMFLVFALVPSAVIINGTAPAACDDLQAVAFGAGKHTEVSGDTFGFYSRCEVTDRSSGMTVTNTEINVSGLVIALGGCVAAWFFGAMIGGLCSLRRGLVTIAGALLVSLLGLLTFFVA